MLILDGLCPDAAPFAKQELAGGRSSFWSALQVAFCEQFLTIWLRRRVYDRHDLHFPQKPVPVLDVVAALARVIAEVEQRAWQRV